MSDVEERVRRGLDELAAAVPVDPVAPPQIVANVRRSRRRRATALTAGSAVILAVLVGSVAAAVGGPSEPPVIVAGPDGGSFELSDPGAAKFEMSALARSPLSPRADMTGVWTGEELIVWGGTSNGAVTGDGAAYSPATNTWRRIADGPLSARTRHMAVWTGREMVVWGGTLRPAGVGDLLDGAAYNPTTDTWRTISSSPPGTDRTSAATAFAGGSAVFGGGFSSTEATAQSVLVYDVAADTWAQHDAGGNVVGMTPFDGHVAIATVDTLDRTGLDLGLLDPATGRTQSLPEFPDIPADAYLESVGLSGSDSAMFAAATVADDGGNPTTKVAVFDAGSSKWKGLRTYSADTFQPGAPAQTPYAPGPTEWTGTWLVSWWNGPAGVAPGTNRTIDRLATSSIPCGAAGVSVWTGDQLLQWGGQNCRRIGSDDQVDTGVSVRIELES
jgi:N-acetylneuraminic acid mutarotase